MACFSIWLSFNLLLCIFFSRTQKNYKIFSILFSTFLTKETKSFNSIYRKTVPFGSVSTQSTTLPLIPQVDQVYGYLNVAEKMQVHIQRTNSRGKMSRTSTRLWEGQPLASILIYWHFPGSRSFKASLTSRKREEELWSRSVNKREMGNIGWSQICLSKQILKKSYECQITNTRRSNSLPQNCALK